MKLEAQSTDSPSLSNIPFGATIVSSSPVVSNQMDFSQPVNIVFFSMGF